MVMVILLNHTLPYLTYVLQISFVFWSSARNCMQQTGAELRTARPAIGDISTLSLASFCAQLKLGNGCSGLWRILHGIQ